MYHHSDLLRLAKDRTQTFEREAATMRHLPSFRQRLAARLTRLAHRLEPELAEAPTPVLGR